MNFFSFLALFWLPVSMALAGDLTIMDSLGMSRAAKSGVSEAVVVLELPKEGETPVLKNVDGLKGDIIGRWDEKLKSFRFESVAPGTWQVQTNRDIQRVQILPQK